MLIAGGFAAAAGAFYVFTRPAAGDVRCGEQKSAAAGRQSWRGGRQEMGFGGRSGSGTKILRAARQ